MALRRCVHLEATDAERLSRVRAYRCLAPDPEMPAMPASITLAHWFKWPPQRVHVCVDDQCEKCPLYEKRKKIGAD